MEHESALQHDAKAIVGQHWLLYAAAGVVILVILQRLSGGGQQQQSTDASTNLASQLADLQAQLAALHSGQGGLQGTTTAAQYPPVVDTSPPRSTATVTHPAPGVTNIDIPHPGGFYDPAGFWPVS